MERGDVGVERQGIFGLIWIDGTTGYLFLGRLCGGMTLECSRNTGMYI